MLLTNPDKICEYISNGISGVVKNVHVVLLKERINEEITNCGRVVYMCTLQGLLYVQNVMFWDGSFFRDIQNGKTIPLN